MANMKWSVLLAALFGFSVATVPPLDNGERAFLEKEETVLHLLKRVGAKDLIVESEYEDKFDPFNNEDKFNNEESVGQFFRSYMNGEFVPKDEVFSPTVQQHQNQAAQLFNFFLSARDRPTLYQAAAWARDRFNRHQYSYAFIAAILNHPKTRGVIVPALYEIFPEHFVPVTALHKIYNAYFKGQFYTEVNANYTGQNRNNQKYNHFSSNHHAIPSINNNPHSPSSVFADNDGSPFNTAGTPENPENRISYFTEDVGINAFHAGFHIQFPPFFGSNYDNNYWINNGHSNKNAHKNYNNKMEIQRGEAFYFTHQQLYARYVLERLSNDLSIPEPINFEYRIEHGYNPRLQYENGQAVPARPPNTHFQQLNKNDNNNIDNAHQPNNNQVQNPVIYERRLQEVADSGVVVNEDGSRTHLTILNAVGVFANLAAAPGSSPNPSYYGDFFSTAKNAIGNIVDPSNQNRVAPGAVANYATAARDPAYYQLLAKLTNMFANLQNKFEPYSQIELAFPGVTIHNFNVSSLETYFETFGFNVNNVASMDPTHYEWSPEHSGSSDGYYVRFQRLTSRPFNYKLLVQSAWNTDAVVRVFIGPKYDSNGQEFTLPQASQYFVQLDHFQISLQHGENNINRSSEQFPYYLPDAPTFGKINCSIFEKKDGKKTFVINKAAERIYGFPQRSMLPKGKASGQQFVFYAIISPATNINNINQYQFHSNNVHPFFGEKEDNRSVGYPFDRPVLVANYNTPNQVFKTVEIRHINI